MLQNELGQIDDRICWHWVNVTLTSDLQYSGSQPAAPRRTCPLWTVTSAGHLSGRCCVRRQWNSCIMVGSCPGSCCNDRGWRYQLLGCACSWWTLQPNDISLLHIKTFNGSWNRFQGISDSLIVETGDLTKSAVVNGHTINSQKSLFLVIGRRLKFGDDLQTVISGDFGHL